MLNGPASNLVPIGRGVGPVRAGVRTLAPLVPSGVERAFSHCVTDNDYATLTVRSDEVTPQC